MSNGNGILSPYLRRKEQVDKLIQQALERDIGHCGYVSGKEIRWNIPDDETDNRDKDGAI